MTRGLDPFFDDEKFELSRMMMIQVYEEEWRWKRKREREGTVFGGLHM